MSERKVPRCLISPPLQRGEIFRVFVQELIREIPFKSQPIVEIVYKGKPLEKKYQPDFSCYDEVIVEIKATTSLTGLEEAQLINYLKATGLKVGLLLNFGSKSLEHKRFVYNL